MRKELSKKEGERKRFRARFSRFGSKVNYKGYSEPTLLLTNITDIDTNEAVADHAWFSYTKGFQQCKLKEGAIVEFEARVKKYTKGYVNTKIGINNKSVDYRLSNPTKISIGNRGTSDEMI